MDNWLVFILPKTFHVHQLPQPSGNCSTVDSALNQAYEALRQIRINQHIDRALQRSEQSLRQLRERAATRERNRHQHQPTPASIVEAERKIPSPLPTDRLAVVLFLAILITVLLYLKHGIGQDLQGRSTL